MKSSEVNLLPQDGQVCYYGKIFPEEVAIQNFQRLLQEIDWKHDEVMIFGKKIVTGRKTAWYGEEEFEYTYSKMTKKAALFLPGLQDLRRKVEEVTGLNFNSCLLNLYNSGNEGMGWHSDAEAELGKEPPIASLSFGAGRKFALKHKMSKEKVEVFLENGSLLLMQGITQKFWQHSLPKTKKVTEPRINLTFRNILKIRK